MSPLAWMSGFRTSNLSEAQRSRRDAFSPPRPPDETLLEHLRIVVLDVETSGLNIQRDKVLSIGAVVIEDGAIDLGSQYECTLCRVDQPVTESILIHGIAPSELARGTAPPDALLDFMEFADQCVFFAFHAPFDQRMLARSLKQELGMRLQHPFIDVAELAPMLCPDVDIGRGGLDAWLAHFRLNNSQRHHAAADAMATAEIALVLLSRARSQGIRTFRDLQSRLTDWRRLQRSRSSSL